MVLGQRGHPSETNFKRSRPRRLWDPLSLTEKEKNSKTAAFRFEEACRRLKRNKSHMLGFFGFFFSLIVNQPQCLLQFYLQWPRQRCDLSVRHSNEYTFPPPGGSSRSGIQPRPPALQANSLPSEPPGKPLIKDMWYVYIHTLDCCLLIARVKCHV